MVSQRELQFPEYALLKRFNKVIEIWFLIEMKVLLKYFNNFIEIHFNNIIGLFQ